MWDVRTSAKGRRNKLKPAVIQFSTWRQGVNAVRSKGEIKTGTNDEKGKNLRQDKQRQISKRYIATKKRFIVC